VEQMCKRYRTARWRQWDSFHGWRNLFQSEERRYTSSKL